MLNPEFFEAISHNCNVSDAHYWGYFSICYLLLRLRQLFKIERHLEPWDTVKNEEIFPWIEKKEEVWKNLENSQLKHIPLNGRLLSPFDVEEINRGIVNKGFIYGAGYALFMKPSFFIGLIQKTEEIDGYRVYFVDKEIVRDLFSSPGMSTGKTIYIRQIDIKYRLWENLHSWLNRKDSISEFLLLKFGDPSYWRYPYLEFLEIVNKYSQIVLYHEIAEQEENFPEFNELIKNCKDSKTEHIIRGVKDFLADFSPKGPISKAIAVKDKELLALFLNTQGPYQKKILKKVLNEIKEALLSNNWWYIEKIRDRDFEKWKRIKNKLQEIFELQGIEGIKTFTDKIFKEELVERDN